jgi:hypothetical protein
MDTFETKTTVYTAQSKHYFHARMLVCKYVLEHGAVPFNPFNLWGYFLYELVDRDLVRRGNNNVVRTVDEVWVFGPIADGVLAEIDYAIKLGKPVRYFSIGSSYDKIQPVELTDLLFEPKAFSAEAEQDVRERLRRHHDSMPLRPVES